MNIFVGNLSFDAIEADVKKLFEGFGNVLSAAIVMEKEKKAPKSRGFGFVEMPDEQQALAAIAVLNGKEFMGRALNVAPARPKAETQAVVEVRKRSPAATPNPSGGIGVPLSAAKKAWYRPVFKKTARYKSGRRTHSYMKRQALAGVQVDAKPRRSSQDNPLRWLKKKNQAKPWQKSMGEHKPWKKSAGDAKPWKKVEGERGVRPWKKAEGGSKPWKKPAGDAKPWKKVEGERGVRPWKKAEGGSKPWKKSAGDAKPRRKSAGYKR